MANIKVIAEHSVDIDLLSGGICIDVGCRGFQFSEAMRDLGCKVIAFDLEDMEAPVGVEFMNYAISNFNGYGVFKDTKDQQAKYLIPHHEGQQGRPVGVMRLVDVYEVMHKGEPSAQVDILKLDCEGSEYDILSDPNFRPIPKQLSIEFHMHAHHKMHDQYYDKCMENLLKHYEPAKHELTQAHGAGFNYWDSLFIRKDLL
jgi:FkbM family methyltransferase